MKQENYLIEILQILLFTYNIIGNINILANSHL
jgi:hypothetical protein